ncbi:Transmembrane emp24 domain-containing protein p24delta4 [Tetrabaena socialis]|uniref:Transmembrane emp24 domain-containing protein p24delta4 n=1 Tax=Tetrabaena socialis TaxID=47790 RepID=A0A2J8A5Z7_9CHLO|nr:Transmembrane emp24 domain-containing protein p24delta4 [Tetrabaena socialis]|eukprot:PNH07925.1 Transmembrane emp24 domain-containing protein p24delta4 [Tetrabaena socialis]
MVRGWSALLVAVLIARQAQALEFEMQSQIKCVYEEINANVIVVGEWKAMHKEQGQAGAGPDVLVDVKVEDPHGTVLHETIGKTEGQFAFTSKSSGEYKACFSVRDIQTAYQTKLKVDWRTGVAATDWNAIAKKEHLDALTVELRKLEDNIREVYNEMLMLQNREQEMRNISEETNSRVAWYSIASLGVCVASALLQLWYLRRFFKRKKLL